MKCYKIIVLIFLTLQEVASLPTPPQGLLPSDDSKLKFRTEDADGETSSRSHSAYPRSSNPSAATRAYTNANAKADADDGAPLVSSVSPERRFVDFRHIDRLGPHERKFLLGSLAVTGVGALGTYGGVMLAKHIRDNKKKKKKKKEEEGGDKQDGRDNLSSQATQQQALKPRSTSFAQARTPFDENDIEARETSSLHAREDGQKEEDQVVKRARRLISGKKDWIRLGVAGVAGATAAGSIYAVFKWYRDHDAKRKKAAEAANHPAPGPASSPTPRSLAEWQDQDVDTRGETDDGEALYREDAERRSFFQSRKRKGVFGIFRPKKKGLTRKQKTGIGIGAGLIGFGTALTYGRLKQQQEQQQQEPQPSPPPQPQPAAKPASPPNLQPRSLADDRDDDADRDAQSKRTVVLETDQNDLLDGRAPRSWKKPLLGVGGILGLAGGLVGLWRWKKAQEEKAKRKREKEEDEEAARAKGPGGCRRDVDGTVQDTLISPRQEPEGAKGKKSSSRTKKIVGGGLVALGALGLTGGALGYRAWKKLHPKRKRTKRVMRGPMYRGISVYGRSVEEEGKLLDGRDLDNMDMAEE